MGLKTILEKGKKNKQRAFLAIYYEKLDPETVYIYNMAPLYQCLESLDTVKNKDVFEFLADNNVINKVYRAKEFLDSVKEGTVHDYTFEKLFYVVLWCKHEDCYSDILNKIYPKIIERDRLLCEIQMPKRNKDSIVRLGKETRAKLNADSHNEDYWIFKPQTLAEIKQSDNKSYKQIMNWIGDNYYEPKGN